MHLRRRKKRILGLLLSFGIACFVTDLLVAASPDDLAAGFTSPPSSASPHTYWCWMNGNVTKEGITADLEAMHRVGIGSATIFTVKLGLPDGPVKFLSSDWLDMVKFAASEAGRLGMKLGMENAGGWSSSGGPWVTPEESMQIVVSSELELTGPRHFSAPLPLPPTRLNFYRDIHAVAIPSAALGQIDLAALAPRITGNSAPFDGKKILDGTGVILPLPQPGSPQYVQFEFANPLTVRKVMISVNPRTDGKGEIQVSDDGQKFRTAEAFTLYRHSGPTDYVINAESARFYRILFTAAHTSDDKLNVLKIDLQAAPSIEDYRGKALYFRTDDVAAKPFTIPPELAIDPSKTVDLDPYLKDGKLDWNAPAGQWTILRFGCTITGMGNRPAPREATGLEINKLSLEAARAYWNGIMPKVAAALGPLMGPTFDHLMVDSYEVGSQNWTPKLREEFRERCGYDMFTYLPVLTGKIVGSPEQSERFLWDYRRTIANLFAENYYDCFAEMCHEVGLQFAVEPYGNGPYEELLCARKADRVMGEFWYGRPINNTLKLASSVAHTYGKSLVGAESFTSLDGGWGTSPRDLKPVGDAAFTNGINSYMFAVYTMEPWVNRSPGIAFGRFGSNLERTNTWWEEGKAWMSYITRCQYLLQQGLFVADALYFDGEGAPSTLPDPNPRLPDGYAFDGCTSDVILHRLSVKDGRLTLPDGMSYRVLVLPPSKTMTPELLRKIKELADAGATILATPPVASPSLKNHPQCDEEVKTVADALWKSGKIISDKTIGQVLTGLKLPPDFQCLDKSAHLLYLHRIVDATDLYFVSNQEPTEQLANCSFRVSGKEPELWHPDTGKMEKVALYQEVDGLTQMQLRLEPAGSVFVVFRDKSPGDHPVSVVATAANGGTMPPFKLSMGADGAPRLETTAAGDFEFKTAAGKIEKASVASVPPPAEVTGSWNLSFPPKWGAPDEVTLDKLISWSKHPNPGIKYFSGTATYRKSLSIAANLLGPGRRLYLDLGDVQAIAEVTLNGHDLGILWKPPYSVDIADAAKAGDNDLEIKVTNLWVNRLIGDLQLPEDCERDAQGFVKSWPQWLLDGKPSPTGRFTFTTVYHWKKTDPLRPSGLIGPVWLRPAVVLPVP